MGDQYRPGGEHWEAINHVVRRSGCSESRAILALRVCNHDLERAILSVTGFAAPPLRKRTRRQPTQGPDVDTPPSSDGEDALEPVPPRRPSRNQLSAGPGGLEVFTAETPRSGELQQYALPVLESHRQAKKFNPREGASQQFSLQRLLWALQGRVSHADVLEYFSYFHLDAVRDSINQEVEGVPSIFYAVATNNGDIVKAWITHGGDVNAVDQRFRVPLIAFALLNRLAVKDDTTAVVIVLLTYGADPAVIPSAFSSPVLRDMPPCGPSTTELTDIADNERNWCSGFFRQQLASAMNVAQGYFLSRARTYERPSVRRLQAAAQCNIIPLFGLPFSIVGQNLALRILTERLLSYLVVPNTKPLVLMFAGRSGHGKTELGRRLGSLLSLEMQTVDMTETSYETDLFGPKAPYIGSEVGSPLNNFLSRMSGKRGVVFLDELEKSKPEVLDSLLILFDEGKYVDRRNRRQVDCSKMIWILASNALDPVITEFKRAYEEENGEDEDYAVMGRQLQPLLTAALKAKFGFPLSGRISSIIPFLPFSTEEQAVIAHKYILQLAKDVRRPVSLSKQLIGNVILYIGRESAVCTALINNYYDPDIGARSLEAAVKGKVEASLVREYLAVNERIDESQPVEEYVVDLDQHGQIKVEMGSSDGRAPA